MVALRVFAPAKLNLFLHVTGKRPDGYHLLESLVAFTELGDALELEAAEALILDISGPFAAALPPPQEDNLVLTAARLLRQATGYPGGAHITLHKQLPVGAGIGGGSSDAAAALKGLCQLWQLAPEPEDMQALALQLGSDVPVCFGGHVAWVRGIGEELRRAALPDGIGVVLVNPGMPLLTAEVFRGFAGNYAAEGALVEHIPSLEVLLSLLKARKNSLETPAITLLPVISHLLAAIAATQDCRLSRMSGSGATCFGLYDSLAQAETAAEALRAAHPGWWCAATVLQEES